MPKRTESRNLEIAYYYRLFRNAGKPQYIALNKISKFFPDLSIERIRDIASHTKRTFKGKAI